MQEIILRLFEKTVEERNANDYKKIIPLLMQTVSFFKERKLKEFEMQDIVANLKLVKKEQGAVICKFGDEGEDFFIILKGRCSVWVPVSNANVVLLLNDFFK